MKKNGIYIKAEQYKEQYNQIFHEKSYNIKLSFAQNIVPTSVTGIKARNYVHNKRKLVKYYPTEIQFNRRNE